jgi:hypothetical protein
MSDMIFNTQKLSLGMTVNIKIAPPHKRELWAWQGAGIEEIQRLY